MANTTWSATDKTANITLTGSNLIATTTSTGNNGVRGADPVSTGKIYWETTVNVLPAGASGVGIAVSSANLAVQFYNAGAQGVGLCGLNTAGTMVANGVNAGLSFGAMSAGVVICFAVDLGAALMWIRRTAAGNWNTVGTNNPATGVGGVAIGLATPVYAHAALFSVNGAKVTANFGDSAFAGVVPSGFTAGWPGAAAAGAAQAMVMVMA